MKCEHLIKIPMPERINLGLDEMSKDILTCIGSGKCPKKKQPCEINARCWRIGKTELQKALDLEVGEGMQGEYGAIIRSK